MGTPMSRQTTHTTTSLRLLSGGAQVSAQANAPCPVQFKRMPDRIRTFQAIIPPNQEPIGYLRHDSETGRWIARSRGSIAHEAIIMDFRAAADAAAWFHARTINLAKLRNRKAKRKASTKRKTA